MRALLQSLQDAVANWKSEITTVGTDTGLRACNALAGIVTARALLPEGKGALTAILLWVNIYNVVFGTGINQASLYYSGRYKGGEKEGAVIGSVIAVGLFQGIVLTSAGVLSVNVVLDDYSPHTQALAEFVFIWAGLRRVLSYSFPILQGYGVYTTWNRLRLVRDAGYALGVVALWALGRLSVGVALICFVASQTAAFLTGWWKILRRVEEWSISWQCVVDLGSYGIKTYFSDVSQRAGRQLDEVVVSTALGAASLGLYRVAKSVGSFASVIPTSVSRILVSEISRNRSYGSYASVVKPLKVIAAVTIVVSILGVVVSPWVVPIVFGGEYTGAVVAAQILIAGAIVFGMQEMAGSIVRGRGRPAQETYASFLRVLATVPLVLVFVNVAGIEGAASGLIGGSIISTLLLIYYVRKE